MVRRESRSSHGPCGVLFIVALLLAVDEVLGAEPGDATDPPDFARASRLSPVVLRAVRDASAKLANPLCQEVFSDFRDAAGRTLAQDLEALGLTGEGYLRWTLFYDGYGKKDCESRDVMATTTPGSRAIFLCMAQFSTLAQREPSLAAILIIHEELHSLGLGERPPDSRVITAQVILRCGK